MEVKMDFSAYFETEAPLDPQTTEVFLAKLDEADWRRFLSVAQRRVFRAGETVVSQGEVSRAFYLAASGRLQVVARDAQGVAHHVHFIEPLSIFGEQAFFDGHPRSASVVALSAGELYGIAPEAFEVLSARHPDIARNALLDLGRILSLRLREMTELALRGRTL
jgi:CRP-like cAMP-binding protein